MAHVHAGNLITPARVTRGLDGFSSLMNFVRNSDDNRKSSSVSNIVNITHPRGRPETPTFRPLPSINVPRGDRESAKPSHAVHVNYSPKITVNGGSPEAKQDFAQMLDDHSRVITDLVRQEIDNREARA